MKRLFDISVACVGIITFGPIMFIIALAIYLEDADLIFFKQNRLGKYKVPFQIYKFRTMRDGEVTKVGRWLRRTGLDELAQIINILKGDMSVVGPRPLTLYDVERLGWNGHTFRWDIKPGLTGLAQLYGGQSAEQSLQADKAYQRQASFKTDVLVILWSLLINTIGKLRVRRHITKNDLFHVHQRH